MVTVNVMNRSPIETFSTHGLQLCARGREKYAYRETCNSEAFPLSSDALTASFPNRRLLEIDISSNKLPHLPPGFLHLSKLQKLTASKNYLEKLFEEEGGMLYHRQPDLICHFVLDSHLFTSLLFSLSLATNWIGLRKLQELDISDNRLTELPALFLHCFKSLSSLNVSRNNLKVFPGAWACPLVSIVPEITKDRSAPPLT